MQTERQGEYQALRLDTIRREIEMVERGFAPRFDLLGNDTLAYWREQERIGEGYLAQIG